MPVVSDASPLILLARVGRLRLLKDLYTEVVIPFHVRDEITKHDDESSFLIISEIEKGWIKQVETEVSPEIRKIGEKLGLHQGEMHALTTAVKQNYKEILVDDKLARIAARILGLRAIGCIGIVMKAYETGAITKHESIDVIQKLVKAGLWISPEVLAEVFSSLER